MIAFGADFAKKLGLKSQESAQILELVGDVGTGKTTFTRGLAQGLGLKSPVTSPSFTISRTYALPDGRSLVHYDFYRLPDPGLMADDLAETLNSPQNIVVIEWGGSVRDLLPASRFRLEFRYNDDDSHSVEIAQEPK